MILLRQTGVGVAFRLIGSLSSTLMAHKWLLECGFVLNPWGLPCIIPSHAIVNKTILVRYAGLLCFLKTHQESVGFRLWIRFAFIEARVW